MKRKTVSKKFSSKDLVSHNYQAALIVKIIAIFGYVSAASVVILGALLLFKDPSIIGMLPMAELYKTLGVVADTFIRVFAIMMIIFSAFWVLLSRSLWMYKNWARIVFIVFAAIGVVNSIFTLPSGIISLLANGVIIYFLTFDKSVVALFK
jgi:hypothetical protein